MQFQDQPAAKSNVKGGWGEKGGWGRREKEKEEERRGRKRREGDLFYDFVFNSLLQLVNKHTNRQVPTPHLLHIVQVGSPPSSGHTGEGIAWEFLGGNSTTGLLGGL